MNKADYDSLTRMERECLRLAHYTRKAEQIAHELGISPSTVNTHIFSARHKLRGLHRNVAGEELRQFEAAQRSDADDLLLLAETDACPDAPLISPQTISRQSVSMGEWDALAANAACSAEVRESRATFDFEDRAVPPGEQDREPRDELLRRMLLILAIAALAALILIACPAIYDSAAQRVANSLERPHTK